MTQLTHKGLTFIVVLIFASAAWTQDGSENGVWSHEAKNHIGEFAMVCGVIVGVRRERQPVQVEFKYSYPNYSSLMTEHTILYFDKLPPHHEFMVVIEEVYRRAFLEKPESFVDQKACIYGRIWRDGNKEAITLHRAFQIAIEAKEKDGK